MHKRVAGSTSKHILGIFLDFKGDFNHLFWDVVMARFQQLGCKEINLWCSCFNNGIAILLSESFKVSTGVVRGCK